MAVMTSFEADVRLAVYRHFIDVGRAPTPVELAAAFGVAPMQIAAALRHLQEIHDAVVMLPGGRYLWMAEPFSAVPTSYVATTGDGRSWFGNCVWDGLGILVVLASDGVVTSACPTTGSMIELRIESGKLSPTDTIAHFAVAASDWWRSIGFT
jgi:hypothetical protein